VVVRLTIAGLLLAVALAIALVAERRKRSRLAPAHRSYDHPRQLDRHDFDRPEAPWLVVVFSSAACEGCRPVAAKAAVLASDSVAVSECEFTAQRSLHERYGIEGVPTTVIADAEGVVRRGFIGAVTATDLWAAVADVRNPPTEPRVCSEHAHDDHASADSVR
jgi:Thioredoxin